VSLHDDLGRLNERVQDYAAARDLPKGWEPGIEVRGEDGSAVVRLPRPGASEHDLLLEAGFDPDLWRIKGPVHYRKWQRHDHEWLHYYRFDTTSAGESPAQRAASVDELHALIAGQRSAPRAPQAVNGTDAWVYHASDWQIGKGEGDGSEGTVQRVLDSLQQAYDQVLDLRRRGRMIPHGALLCTGDLGEGTCGFYPNQAWSTDLNRRDQNRVTRMLLTTAVDTLSPLFEKFTVGTVGGNHGENRQGGKVLTDDSDNDDVAQLECVKEAFDRVGDSNIEWIIPRDELSLCVELGGVKVGLTHGHLFSGGGKLVQAKALEWWKGQAFGLQAVADARVLVSSHFHHFSMINHGTRTHLQTPAMDPGSRWVSNAWGLASPAGVLTLRYDANEPLGWADLQVLGGR
jgi:hypothetical protein